MKKIIEKLKIPMEPVYKGCYQLIINEQSLNLISPPLKFVKIYKFDSIYFDKLLQKISNLNEFILIAKLNSDKFYLVIFVHPDFNYFFNLKTSEVNLNDNIAFLNFEIKQNIKEIHIDNEHILIYYSIIDKLPPSFFIKEIKSNKTVLFIHNKKEHYHNEKLKLFNIFVQSELNFKIIYNKEKIHIKIPPYRLILNYNEINNLKNLNDLIKLLCENKYNLLNLLYIIHENEFLKPKIKKAICDLFTELIDYKKFLKL